MAESFDFSKALTRLARSDDLADASLQYLQFRQLLAKAASQFEVKCSVSQADGESGALQVVTPLGAVVGRMAIRVTDNPHAVALFDGVDHAGELAPLYAVYLPRHESWSDSRGQTFNQDAMNDVYTVGVGRVALTAILRAQMLQLNADVERYAR